MKKQNPIQEKSYYFALHIVLFCKNVLIEKKREYVLSKQLLKSGTSIGANVEEGIHAPSKKDFANKLSIALKEAHETKYWLSLLRDTGYASEEEIKHLLPELTEVIALLTSIIKTARISIV